MRERSPKCKYCESENIVILDDKYYGDWSSLIYECTLCSREGEIIYHKTFNIKNRNND